MARYLRLVLPILALLVVLAACGTRQGPAAQPQEATTLRVENQSFSDMRIYAVDSGRRTRLGTVTGTRTAVLRIPSSMVTGGRELSFEANPIGSRAAANSFRIWVDPGDEITITIPSQIR